MSTEWTVGDLDRLPDDGLRYELLDGIRDGRHVVVGEAAGDQPVTVSLPFPVMIVPADLIR